MGPRREDLTDDAEVALAEALRLLQLRLTAAADGADLAVDLEGGRTAQFHVEALANATPGRVRAKVDAVGREDAILPVLVADAIPRASRRVLDQAKWGWYDRRGHLKLQAPGLHLDTVATPTGRDSTSRSPVMGRAGIAVAYELLRHLDRPLAVRRTAASTDLNPSSVSRALTRLKEAALVTNNGTPLVPELFWALADVWPRDATPLKREPDPQDPRVEGWVAGGTRGALAWGAPLVAAPATPSELFAPSAAAVRLAQQRFGRAPSVLSAAALVRVAPTPAALEEPMMRSGESWPVAHPLAVALELATDRTRGAEVLESWTPPPPYVRVW